MFKRKLLHQRQTLVKIGITVVLSVHLLIVLIFWYKSSGFYLNSGDLSLRLIAIGRLIGLIAVSLVLLQFALIGRLPILEQTFGQDRIGRAHQLLGRYIIGIILLHPIFIILGNALLSQVNVFSQYSAYLSGYPGIVGASLAVSCAVAVAIGSNWTAKHRIKYEWWYLIHLLSYLVVLFAFSHQIKLGTTINYIKFFNIYWYLMYFIVLASFIFFRLIRPTVGFFKYDFQVAGVVCEAPDVVSIYITGKNLSKYKWKPGQFGFFTFFSPGLQFEAHPFSFSTMWDHKRNMRITVKAVGDYTRLLQAVPVGTRVLVQGPYGILGRQIEGEREVLLVAAGIGVSAIRCLFERYVRSGRDVELIYAVRSAHDFALKAEFDALASLFDNCKVHYLAEVGAETVAGADPGRINKDYLLGYVNNIPGRKAFISAPPDMVDTVESALLSVGMPKDKIFVERYYLGRSKKLKSRTI